MNERLNLDACSSPPADRNWVQSAISADVPRVGLRGLGVGSSAAVTRSSSPSHSASPHRSAAMSICGLAPGYGSASDTRFGMGAPRCRGLNEELIVADRADHLAVDVGAVLTEHRLGRDCAGPGRLLKQEIDCALLRRHRPNLKDGRRRGQRTDDGLRR